MKRRQIDLVRYWLWLFTFLAIAPFLVSKKKKTKDLSSPFHNHATIYIVKKKLFFTLKYFKKYHKTSNNTKKNLINT
jgi:hypothetical protein